MSYINSPIWIKDEGYVRFSVINIKLINIPNKNHI